MRIAYFVALLFAGCAAADAQSTAPSDTAAECRQDADCFVAPAPRPCCAGCCECPRAMSREEWSRLQRWCASVSCEAVDCSHVRCEPCGIASAAACRRGQCVPR